MSSYILPKLKVKEQEIAGFFSGSNPKKGVRGKLDEKIAQISHLLRTGIWVNKQAMGRELNLIRATKEGANVEKVENSLRSISDKLVNEVYEEAMHETFFEAVENSWEFFKEFLHAPTVVGSLMPSSTKMAKMIAEEVFVEDEESEEGRNILEVGPGTGVFTEELIKRLKEKDHLVLVEFDDKFVELLQRKFAHLKNVEIVKGDFTTFTSDRKFDHIVSGLPLAAFPSKMVNTLYQQFEKLAKPGKGKLSYFEYMAIPSIRKRLLRGEKKKDFENILETKKSHYKKGKGRKRKVYLNVTPANICTLSLQQSCC